MSELRPHQLKRIAYNAAVAPNLRGAVVTIVGFVEAHYDVPRVRVRLVNDDGSAGEEYRVQAGILINV